MIKQQSNHYLIINQIIIDLAWRKNFINNKKSETIINININTLIYNMKMMYSKMSYSDSAKNLAGVGLS